jgi:hypothetical protein
VVKMILRRMFKLIEPCRPPAGVFPHVRPDTASFSPLSQRTVYTIAHAHTYTPFHTFFSWGLRPQTPTARASRSDSVNRCISFRTCLCDYPSLLHSVYNCKLARCCTGRRVTISTSFERAAARDSEWRMLPASINWWRLS